MKLVIAGTRDFNLRVKDLEHFIEMFELQHKIRTVISGGAKGVDAAAELLAKASYESVVVPADWDMYGNKAGPIRNAKMAAQGDALLLIWDGSSPGSKSMKWEMVKLNKPIYEVVLRSFNVKNVR